MRRAALAPAELIRPDAPEVGDRLSRCSRSGPLAMDGPAPALEAVMARAIDYLESAERVGAGGSRTAPSVSVWREAERGAPWRR